MNPVRNFALAEVPNGVKPTEISNGVNNYVVVVGGGKDSVLVIEKIHKLGLKAMVVDRNPNSPSAVCADKKIILSTFESKPIIRELKRFQSNHKKIAAVVTRSSGIPAITTAEISDALSLPGAGAGAARVLTYKDLFTELCIKYGIPTARIQISDFFKKRKQILDHLPCVVKPTLGFIGKKGVMLIQKESEINLAVENARKSSLDGNVLIEKYIPGIDISLISIVYDGSLCPCFFLKELNKFDKKGKIDFKGFCLFDGLKDIDKKEIIRITKRIVEAANVAFSPFLISFRLTSDGKAIPIEVNLDFGGENILEKVIPAKKELDFIKCYLESIIHKIKPKIPKIFIRNTKNQ